MLARLTQSFNRFLDWSTSDLGDDLNLQWQGRTLVTASMLVLVSAPVFAVVCVWQRDWVMLGVNLVTLAFVPAVVFILRWTRSPVATAHTLGFPGFLGICYAVLAQPGSGVTMLSWFGFLVLILVLGAGRAVGAIYALMSLAFIAFMSLSDRLTSPSDASDEVVLSIGVANALVFVIFGLASALIWDRARRHALEQAHRAGQRARDAERKALLTERMASVGTLATGVAHELNTPLTYLTLNLEQMASGRLSLAEIQRLASESVEGAERMRDIVAQLQTFSRSESSANLRVISLERPVRAALRMLDNQLKQRCALELRIDEQARAVSNEGQLAQVVVNLIQNALHAIVEEPDPKVSVSVQVRGKTVVIEVSDNGMGMEPEVSRRIFEPFFTTKAQQEGTGLGLSICQGIVEENGGQIGVRSTPGVGTTFTIELPRSFEEETPLLVEQTNPVIDRRLDLVVVDDDEQLGRVVKRALRDTADVTTFVDARQALTHLNSSSPDLILCDVMMPNMPGWEFFSELEGRSPTLSARVVFMSGGGFTERGKAFIAQQRGRLLTKPFNAGELQQAVTDAVKGLPDVRSGTAVGVAAPRSQPAS